MLGASEAITQPRTPAFSSLARAVIMGRVTIRYVSLDAGGTLLAPHPSVGEVYARAGAPLGLEAPPAALEAAFRSAWRRHVSSDPSAPATMGHDDASARAFWRRLVEDVFEAVAYRGAREACFSAMYDAFARPEAWRVFEDVRPTLEALAARGVRVGVLSNWDHRLHALLDTLGLRAWLDPVIISAEVGVSKPDRRIFTLALERAGFAPEEALHVGDDRALDLEAARGAGLRGLLLDRAGRAPEGGDVLSDLRDLLERL